MNYFIQVQYLKYELTKILIIEILIYIFKKLLFNLKFSENKTKKQSSFISKNQLRILGTISKPKIQMCNDPQMKVSLVDCIFWDILHNRTL